MPSQRNLKIHDNIIYLQKNAAVKRAAAHRQDRIIRASDTHTKSIQRGVPSVWHSVCEKERGGAISPSPFAYALHFRKENSLSENCFLVDGVRLRDVCRV